MRRLVFALPLAALLLLSQTRTHTSQIRGPVAADGRVLAIVNGRVVLATVGQGLQLVQSSSGYELRALQTGAVTERRLTRSSDGSWSLPSGCVLRAVFRNGLRQGSGLDYSVSGSAIRFTDGQSDPSLAEDVVVADCGN